VSDPGSTAYFGGSKWASAAEVPETGANYYLATGVPHGQEREIWYHLSMTRTWQHALVYLPPKYDTQGKIRYPVLYLQHDGGVEQRRTRVELVDCLLGFGMQVVFIEEERAADRRPTLV
jgi:enterochelin esterase-like enzyme